MSKIMFNPGSKAKIISREAPVIEETGYEKLSNSFEMPALHVGSIVTIESCNEKGGYYKIHEDGGLFMWMSEWLGPVGSDITNFINSLPEDKNKI